MGGITPIAPHPFKVGEVIRHYLQFPVAIPAPRVRHLRLTTPFAAFRFPEGKLLARLACLIHAANVHSEPGSNPFDECLCRHHPKAVAA